MSLRILLPEDQIQTRIKELGAQIDADYPTGALHLVCILKGAYVFLADLARAIKRDTFVEFMGISSYGKGKTSSGEVKVTKDLDHSVEGANVLIVEDIVDSGVTLSYLMGAAPAQAAFGEHRGAARQAGAASAACRGKVCRVQDSG
jgi:hypoxanthine phosphoribosyltransferase